MDYGSFPRLSCDETRADKMLQQHLLPAQSQALVPRQHTSTPNTTSAKTFKASAANERTSARSRRQVHISLLHHPPSTHPIHILTIPQHKAKASLSGTNSKPKSAASLPTTKPSGRAMAATPGRRHTPTPAATGNTCCRMACSPTRYSPCT